MTKEQKRDEQHRTIWQIANDLRGSVNGWDVKSLYWIIVLQIYLGKPD
jgi:type I restriction-modification system DNA methylase subunit